MGGNLPLLGTGFPSQDHSHVVCFNVAPSFVGLYPVTLIHRNSSEGHRAVAIPLILLNCFSLHHSQSLSIHKPMGLLAQDSVGRS